jgi:hemerythrin
MKKIRKFAWQDDYSVGDASIDAQHRRIIDILNLLHDLLHSEAVGDDFTHGLREVFWELHAYVAEHFTYEEQRMAEAQVPAAELSAHRAEHARLTERIVGFENAIANGDGEAIAKVLPFLYGDWLVAHICGSDQRYAPYLHSH